MWEIGNTWHCGSLTGSLCVHVGVTKLPYGYCPLLLHNGELACQKKTGRVQTIRLSSHNFSDEQDLSDDEVEVAFTHTCIGWWLGACRKEKPAVNIFLIPPCFICMSKCPSFSSVAQLICQKHCPKEVQLAIVWVFSNYVMSCTCKCMYMFTICVHCSNVQIL